jgi:transposase
MGLDVDARSAFVVVRDEATGRMVDHRRVASRIEAWGAYLGRFPGCRIRAYYEAGCTGFGLQRLLTSLGVPCRVVPASDVAKEANAEKMKTDARDAWRLSQTPWVPPHSYARVPTVEQERDRQLIRTREQLRKDRARTKDRIGKLLLFHSLAPPEDVGPWWSTSGMVWLRDVEFSSMPLRLSVDSLLSELDHLDHLVRQVERGMRQLSRAEPYRDAATRLQSIPGVGLVTAMTFLTEVFRAEEFSNARQLAAHVGLTPSEWSSGGRRRQGRITRWGAPHLRRVLVEAAWRWVGADEGARRCYAALTVRRGRKKAVVAMARRLAIAMWAIVKKGETYQYHWAA